MRGFREEGARRAVVVKSTDPAIPDQEWILRLDPAGVSIHKKGDRALAWRLAWRSVIAHAIMGGQKVKIEKRRKPVEQATKEVGT